MQIFHLLLFFSIFLLSCQTNTPSTQENKMQRGLKYLALGDSYTIGETLAENERYPNILVEKLKADQLDIQELRIIATTGWTTTNLKEAIEKENPSADQDLVSLLIGVNNQYQGKEIGLYEKEFEELLKTAIRLAKNNSKRVFVVSIPDYGVTPFAAQKNSMEIAQEIDIYNAIAEGICEKYGVAYFDITPISKRAKDDLTLLANDQLHPSGKMYALWVTHMAEGVRKLLK